MAVDMRMRMKSQCNEAKCKRKPRDESRVPKWII